jgi:zinc/manganese transport system permease protein
VRIAGVLLVFSYLIVPALAATALTGAVATRLVIGWSFGAAVSLGGVAASAVFDLPTGATVVCAFGVTLFLGWALVHATGGRVLGRVLPRGGQKQGEIRGRPIQSGR